ncbi:hypothetical protein CDD80_4783 [Ophiocordyceps camponoti-rufipedis]|uniref:Glycosyl hydrolase family 32 N-terminal domain-containing protein n=1 Tax=Ophiocordyceps camponoti-rufipedis TaxID=2004952 RepID=A0A2C5XUS7_9HYPO|nr:hypothetical protein CDD80_4783 [Ophiocordyceps camponoti-rufipedis]
MALLLLSAFAALLLRATAAAPDSYSGPYRPQVHYSPPINFMNDPNGLFRAADGTWHLYYQYNPTGLVAGNQHWGHATSPDLYHWTNQPIALSPPNDHTFVFSGSAVVDVNNTSGFFPGRKDGVVAIYTLSSPDRQEQAISFSYDGGYTFTSYDGNPVIPGNSSQFRDPKVIRHDDRWVMAVAYPDAYAVGLFTSPNLIDWTPVSNFSLHGLLGIQWECPNLVRVPYIDYETGASLDDMWLMVVSVNPGGPLGGSTTQYFPGTFNGTHFEAVDSAVRFADFAKDYYAGQFYYGIPDQEAVFISWASNWQYAEAVPTAQEGWRSAMSLPRRTALTSVPRLGWKLVSQPYDLSPVLGSDLVTQTGLANRVLDVDFANVASNALYWEANVTGVSADAILNVSFTSSRSGERLSSGYLFGSGTFFLDRGQTRGFQSPLFTDKFSITSLPRSGDSWSISGVFDRSMVEVFLDRGVDSATAVFFAKEPLTRMEIASSGLPEHARVSVRVNALRSVWN